MARLGRKRAGSFVVAAALAIAISACDEDDDPPTTASGYLSELEEVCIATLADLEALPSPPELITVEDFAADASALLAGEAEAARRLQPPRDDGLDDDHRAFVLNTDEQAAAWASIGAGASDEELAELTRRIGELVLGRDDLVVAMGAPECVRGGAALQGSDS